jgi:hypothetical protein
MKSPDAFAALIPVVEELERLGVRYYVGGSISSSAYGHMRSTQDADLIADLKPAHVEPLVKALQNTYYANAHAAFEAIAHQRCFNLIHLATMFKVDIFIVKDRQYDRMALSRAQKRRLDDEDPATDFYLASPEDVILGKLEWYRLGDESAQQQWLDVTKVMKVQFDNLDRDYLEKWAGELRVADLLERAWKEVLMQL